MDGVHDLGGKPGFGAVAYPENSRPFSKRWQAVVFAMVRAGASAGAWRNSDRFRHAIERIHPQAYLEHGYYGRWLGGIETLLVEAGVISRREIDVRAASLGATADDLIASQPAAKPDEQGPMPSQAGSDRSVARSPMFQLGDRVLTAPEPVAGHTRLPAYARGATGVVTALHDAWVFPDTNAHGLGEQAQYVYTVRFTSETLWQREGFTVSLDLFEPYLSAVSIAP